MKKTCKFCKSEIDKDAKRCPKCHGDLRKWPARHPILTGLMAIIGLIVLVSSAGGKGGSSKTGSSSNQTQEAQYKVGDTIKTDNFEVTITSAKERGSVGSSYFRKSPSEGGTFLAVQWSYKNISSNPVNAFKFPSVKLVDSNSTTYGSDIGASADFATELNLDRKILSDLNPGITVKDASVFEINKGQFEKGGWKLLIGVDGKDIKVGL
jgi:hypothetical protein